MENNIFTVLQEMYETYQITNFVIKDYFSVIGVNKEI